MSKARTRAVQHITVYTRKTFLVYFPLDVSFQLLLVKNSPEAILLCVDRILQTDRSHQPDRSSKSRPFPRAFQGQWRYFSAKNFASLPLPVVQQAPILTRLSSYGTLASYYGLLIPENNTTMLESTRIFVRRAAVYLTPQHSIGRWRPLPTLLRYVQNLVFGFRTTQKWTDTGTEIWLLAPVFHGWFTFLSKWRTF